MRTIGDAGQGRRPRGRALRRAAAIAALALVAGLVQAPAAGASPVRPRPVDPVRLIAEAFEEHRVVAIGEFHGVQDQLEMLASIVTDRRFRDAAQDVVVEFGNARYQGLVDRYVAGQAVELGEVRRAWTDTINVATWDAAIYDRFFVAVRETNRGRPADRQLRVVLADVPIDWSSITRTEQVTALSEQRDDHIAAVVEREVLAQGRRALLIAGVYHVLAFNQVSDDLPRNAVEQLEQRHPGSTFVIAENNGQSAVEQMVSGWRDPSAARLAGTALGASTEYAPAPPGAPHPSLRLDQLADAFLFNGLVRDQRVAMPGPAQYRDARWSEIVRRFRIAFGEFDEAAFFATRCRYPNGHYGPDGRAVRGAVRGARPVARDALTALRDAFSAHRLVALGEAPQQTELHSLLRDAVRSSTLAGADDIVVEFGSAAHQDVVDRYVRGEAVPEAALRPVWQDTTRPVVWDSPVYRALLEAVRDSNRRRSSSQQLRVVLADVPIDWASVRTTGQYREIAARRAAHFARTTEREVLDRGRKALLLVDRWSLADAAGPVRAVADLTGESAYRVLPHLGFGEHGERLEQRLSALPGSVLTLASTWIGGLPARAVLGDAARPSARVVDVADGYLYLGPPSALGHAPALPSTYRDEYWAEVQRRYQLVHGRPLTDAAFPSTSCRPVAPPGPDAEPRTAR